MPPLSEATRPLMWNISHVWVMYGLFVVALAIFAWGIYQRIEFWRQGKADNERLSDWGKRLKDSPAGSLSAEAGPQFELSRDLALPWFFIPSSFCSSQP